MAQTTRLASFGPVFIVPAFHVAHIPVAYSSIESIYFVKKLARRKREEKSLACGPNHLSDVIWACIRQPYLPCHAFLQLNLLLCKTLVRMKRKMKNTCLRPKGRVWRRLGPICHCLGSFIRIADRWWFVGLLAWSQPLVVEGEVRKGRVS